MNDIINDVNFADLKAFLHIARRESFVQAARDLSISPPALSQTLKRLESRLGVRLVNRTTRSVALTEAGRQLCERVLPLMNELGATLTDVTASASQPAGLLRLTLSRVAAKHLILPNISSFAALYPRIVVDLNIEDRLTDIVAGRFDAGIRLGDQIEPDLIALRLGPQRKCCVVAAPSLLASAGVPAHPRELMDKPCLRFRWPGGEDVYKWEFEKIGEHITLDLAGSLIVNDTDVMLNLAAKGLGFAYALDCEVAPFLRSGDLVPVLEDWLAPFSGFHLYHSSRRHVPMPLRLFIDFMKAQAFD